MISIPDILSENLATAIGWTVFHSLWQALLIAMMVAAGSFILRRRSARLRYLIGNLGLALILVASAVTFIRMYQPGIMVTAGTADPIIAQGFVAIQGAGVVVQDSLLQQWLNYFEQHLPLIVTVWLLGVAIFSLRLLGGLLFLQQLRFRGVRSPEARWTALADGLAMQLGIQRPVRLLESSRINVPMVLGYLKPVILMPIGAINSLTPRQVEAILAHEMAHIARADYLFNILQSVVEVLYYFNPGVWWISANIREERENCCDDIAVQLCGDNLDYARALVQLQEFGWQGPQLAMTLTGNKRQLLQRVKRLLHHSPKSIRHMQWRFAATCCLLVFLILLSGGMGDPAVAHTYETNPGMAIHEMLPVEKLDALKLPDSYNMMALSGSALDTIPQGRSRLEIVRGDESNVEVLTENGKIKDLKLDGRQIPADSLGEYEDMVAELYENMDKKPERHGWGAYTVPTPPSPPVVAFRAPRSPRPPRAPRPPRVATIPGFSNQKKITSEVDEAGNTLLKIEGFDGDVTEVLVKPNADGPVIILDGKTVDPDGSTIILEDPKELFYSFPDSIKWNGLMHDLDSLKSWSFDLDDFKIDLDSLHQGIYAVPHGNWSFNDSLQFNYNWSQNINESIQESLFDVQSNLNFTMDSVLNKTMSVYNIGQGSGRGNFWGKDVQNAFEEQMRKDGLIKAGEGYKLEFSRDNLSINGKKQPEDVLEKYIDLYEEETDSRLHTSTSFVISGKGEE